MPAPSRVTDPLLSFDVVILAAGEGRRMHSALPKVLHPVLGLPMLLQVLTVVGALEPPPDRVVVVIGREGDKVRSAVADWRRDGWLPRWQEKGNGQSRSDASRLDFAVQAEQLGTGHAVQQAGKLLAPAYRSDPATLPDSLNRSDPANRSNAVAEPGKDDEDDTVAVLYGDVPLITETTLEHLIVTHRTHRPAITLLTAMVDDPSGYGRIIRVAPGGEVFAGGVAPGGSAPAGGVASGGDVGLGVEMVARIVEDRDATPAERAIREINAGVYAFRSAWLWPALAGLAPAPNGEVYLTNLVGLAIGAGERVVALRAADADEVMGVNTPEELAKAEGVLRRRSTASGSADPHSAATRAPTSTAVGLRTA